MKKTFLIIATLLSVCALQSSAQTVSGNKDGHDYVDLGLPSGKLWATYNVGASKPTENGEYFAWGETTPKENYDWSTYKWSKGSYDTQTKYCVDSDYGTVYGTVDSLTTLLAEDDAATANWGAGWRMPTITEQEELKNGCNWEWTDDFNGSGVAGHIGTSKTNGNTIFWPDAGIRLGTDLVSAGYFGFYWSSSLYESRSDLAYGIYVLDDDIDWNNDDRFRGESVRAVVK